MSFSDWNEQILLYWEAFCIPEKISLNLDQIGRKPDHASFKNTVTSFLSNLPERQLVEKLTLFCSTRNAGIQSRAKRTAREL